jgi:hypothetical protein
MNTRQNITLSIPQDVLQKAEAEAAQRNMSLSGLFTQLLNDALERDDQYQTAMRRQLSWLKQGWNLGSNGRAAWTREELHEQ